MRNYYPDTNDTDVIKCLFNNYIIPVEQAGNP